MFNIKYEIARLFSTYHHHGISRGYEKGQPLPPPSYVIWDCTRRCNLKCLHCGATKEKYPEELTEEQVKKTIDELAGLGVAMFAVTGGEPLLRKDLVEVLNHAKERGMETGLATNGFLLDETKARQMAEIDVNSVQISLDGLEETHNKIRGNPQSFQRAVQALKFLKETGIPLITASTTATPHNLHELKNLLEFLLDLDIHIWKLILIMPIGRAEEKDLSLSPGQMKEFFQFISESRKKIEIHIGENFTYLGKWEKKIRKEPFACPVGFTVCCIGADGHVRGCPEMKDEEANREGSLLESSFSEIWQQGFGKYRQRAILDEDPRCGSCKVRFRCFGGCWVMREEGQHCIRDYI